MIVITQIDDEYFDRREEIDELLAEGDYESSKDEIIAGFKVFQKKYGFKNVAFQMVLVILGIVTQSVNLFTAAPDADTSFSKLLIILCVILGVYIVTRPGHTIKKLSASLDTLKGSVYNAQIYTNRIIIATIHDEFAAGEENTSDEADTKADSPEEITEEDDIPATIIHLDNGSVDIVETKELFVVYIRKVNVFTIPKHAFKPYEVTAVSNRLSEVMGIRYKKG